MNRPNTVLIALVAAAGAAGLALVIVAAEKHGKRRQLKRAWLTETGRRS